ncbi:MAG: hypothetical protein IPL78_36100 [Chloroflexi bacterium]|nr:hypothetical protein [Chloroflexota bacterium]
MKFTLVCAAFNAELVWETAVRPSVPSISVCSTATAHPIPNTPALLQELLTAIMATTASIMIVQRVWLPNLRLIERLVHQSHGYHLSIGFDQNALGPRLTKQLFSS